MRIPHGPFFQRGNHVLACKACTEGMGFVRHSLTALLDGIFKIQVVISNV